MFPLKLTLKNNSDWPFDLSFECPESLPVIGGPLSAGEEDISPEPILLVETAGEINL